MRWFAPFLARPNVQCSFSSLSQGKNREIAGSEFECIERLHLGSVSSFTMWFLLCQESDFAQIIITVKIRMRLPVKCRVMQFPAYNIYTQIETYVIISSQNCFVASACRIVLMSYKMMNENFYIKLCYYQAPHISAFSSLVQ